MKNNNFKKLFYPQRIGLIGASGTSGRVGNIILNYLKRSEAALFLVNHKTDRIGTQIVYSSPEELPDNLDLVVITIGSIAAVEAAEICSRKGAAFIIVVAGGFGEIDQKGKDLEKQLKILTEAYNCRIIGPNSLGIFYPDSNLDTVFVEHGDRALAAGGGIAVITQSGSVGIESIGLASNSGFGMQAFVGTGNKVDLNECDFISWFAKDPHTTCLALYLESIEGGRTFLEEARTIAVLKPIVILKAGRTEAGGDAVSSHTGSLAGSDNIVNGAFRQYGIQRAYDDEELCDAAKVLSMVAPARGNRVAIITTAGGFGVMCTDYIDSPDQRARLAMSKLADATVKRIESCSLPFASIKNPVDLTAGADDDMYLTSLEALFDDPGVDIIICIAFFAPPSISDNFLTKLSELIRKNEKPVLVFTQYGPNTDRYLKRFFEEGVAGFSSIQRVVRAARYIVERGVILQRMEESGDI